MTEDRVRHLSAMAMLPQRAEREAKRRLHMPVVAAFRGGPVRDAGFRGAASLGTRWSCLRFQFVVLATLVLAPGCQKSESQIGTVASPPPAVDGPTFNQVASIFWERCAYCHRDGEAAPFPLITFTQIQGRATQIQEVIESGYMPPWLPAHSDIEFENDTRLSTEQKQLILAWFAHGNPEGAPDQLPAIPAWTPGWQLGEPDVIVTMPKPFSLPARGPDIYRNFVVPIPTDRIRYVRALEFRPSNFRIVHHAFMLIDPTRQLRRITEGDGEPGFAGMDTKTAISPNGHFIGWQPGRRPYEYPQGMAWQLLPGTDLVLQVHMQCSGKRDAFSASVGIYFTDEAPTRFPSKLMLRSTEIDVPPGVADYPIRDQIQIPVEIDVMAIAPHAHYLAKTMDAIAELPDGTTRMLLTIKDWDLNWQSEYRLQPWARLPAGTVLKQRFTYDNSAANVRNPNNPPQRVTYGVQATDEMGSLWFQVIHVADAVRRFRTHPPIRNAT